MKILVGVTGASGAIYAERLIRLLNGCCNRIYIVFSTMGKKVTRHELVSFEEGFSLVRALDKNFTKNEKETIRIFENDDFFAPIASGSSVPDAMFITPCSMGTMGRVAGGMSSNLIERAADVILKENKPLILLPRETPLNKVHLRNMITLAEAGAMILPAMPGFYNKPKSINELVDFVVARGISLAKITDEYVNQWNSRMV